MKNKTKHKFNRSLVLVSNVPGVKHGPVLKIPVVMHQQDVSILRLSVAEKRSVHDFYLHLGLGQLPPADRQQQDAGAEAAERGQQQHAATVGVRLNREEISKVYQIKKSNI